MRIESKKVGVVRRKTNKHNNHLLLYQCRKRRDEGREAGHERGRLRLKEDGWEEVR